MLDEFRNISILNHFLQNVTCSMWVSQDEDLFDTVFRWPKSAKNGIFDEFSQNIRFFKIG